MELHSVKGVEKEPNSADKAEEELELREFGAEPTSLGLQIMYSIIHL